ncbi:MAG: radical SAM family heme chaperone HemW [Burkholderiaceae bacterium]
MAEDQTGTTVTSALTPRLRAGPFVPPPLGLYVHLPWCLRKCPYCDFNSHERRDDSPAMDDYIDALIVDLEQSLPLIWGRSVSSVFFGGGTPSLFAPAQIDRLLAAVRARVRLGADVEVTLEANPGTFEAERFKAYRDAGVNRLSIGVQSFDDSALSRLGRVHDAAQAEAAIAEAARCFDRYNLDLMFALPGQDMAALQRDLDRIRAWRPPHWSCYQLTIEPNTLFARFTPPNLPDDDLAADMFEAVHACAADIGLQRYEVSAFAAPGQRCRHNLNYWRFGDYLGLGAGAHGKLSFHDKVVRHSRWRHPRRYLEAVARGTAVEHERVLGPADMVFEFALNAFRLVDGVPTELFEAHTGLSRAALGARLLRAAQDGLLDPDPSVLRPTAQGLRFLNDLTERFLP